MTRSLPAASPIRDPSCAKYQVCSPSMCPYTWLRNFKRTPLSCPNANPVPSAHWFKVLSSQIPELYHHCLSLSPPPAPQVISATEKAALRGRCMQIRKMDVFPVEVIVRGYITGSAWNESVTRNLKRSWQFPDRLADMKSTAQSTAWPSQRDCNAVKNSLEAPYTL